LSNSNYLRFARVTISFYNLPMTDQPAEDLKCANCGQPLDVNDKFCRECGLPTVRHAVERQAVKVEPPDTREMKRALEVPEPKPFVRVEPEPFDSDDLPGLPPDTLTTPAVLLPPETTGDVVRATSPTQVTRMATSTLVMLGLIAVLAIAGVVLIVLAFNG
jgi:hypothetical protein